MIFPENRFTLFRIMPAGPTQTIGTDIACRLKPKSWAWRA
jgi:hypothetical protein